MDKHTKTTLNAMDYKDKGNRLYNLRKYNDAISCYTKAIAKNPTISTFYTNRALCYIKLKQWEMTCNDCKRAQEIESSSVKSHFFYGQALLEMALYDESIAALIRAHDLAKDQKLNFGDDITSTLRQAKKRRWNAVEEKRIQQEIELQAFLNNLVIEEKQRQLNSVSDDSDNEIDTTAEKEKIGNKLDNRLKEINELFSQVDERRKRREVPEHLCGKISFEILRNPVITPSGITYDKKDIEEHLQRVGHFDPLTRKELTQGQLIPNLLVKEVIDVYLKENPWAEDY